MSSTDVELSSDRPTAHHTVEVGAIFVANWGWEQTNIDFYQVVHVTPRTVVVQPIQSSIVRQVGWAAEEVEPVPDSTFGPRLRRTVTDDPDAPFIGITSYKIAELWNGKPCVATYYG